MYQNESCICLNRFQANYQIILLSHALHFFTHADTRNATHIIWMDKMLPWKIDTFHAAWKVASVSIHIVSMPLYICMLPLDSMSRQNWLRHKIVAHYTRCYKSGCESCFSGVFQSHFEIIYWTQIRTELCRVISSANLSFVIGLVAALDLFIF